MRQVAVLAYLRMRIVVHDHPAIAIEDGEGGEGLPLNGKEVWSTRQGGRELAQWHNGDIKVTGQLVGIEAIERTQPEFGPDLFRQRSRLGLEAPSKCHHLLHVPQPVIGRLDYLVKGCGGLGGEILVGSEVC